MTVYQQQPDRDDSGRLDGGWFAGDANEARDADVLLEDRVGPPNHSTAWERDRPFRVESTPTETRLLLLRDDGGQTVVHTMPHPQGMR